jgi:AraC-like DNA-binding protein/DNA gyrase inhibitor GyrI
MRIVIMNLYERIQRAIDYIESHLNDEIDIAEAAKQAFMSRAGMYRLFNAFTGYDIKEYIRRRRFEKACSDLEAADMPTVEVAMKYGYSTQDAFIKSFKAVVGTTPGRYSKTTLKYKFEKVNLLEMNFEVVNQQLKSKYPEIEVLSNLPRMRVASYWVLSESPEEDGYKVIMAWAKKNKLLKPDNGARIFGFDYPSYFAQKRGYEWWVTVPGHYQFNKNDSVKEKYVPEGMYALISIAYKKNDFNDFIGKLFEAKGRFAKWCRESEYGFAFHQYLEESVITDDNENNIRRSNLYFPICRDASTKEPIIAMLQDFHAAVIQVDGEASYDKAWDLFYKWSELSGDYSKHKVLQMQDDLNKSWGVPAELWVTNPPESVDLNGLDIRHFSGGRYLKFLTEFTSMNSELEENCFKIYQSNIHDKRDDKLIIEFMGKTEDWNTRTLTCLYYPLM